MWDVFNTMANNVGMPLYYIMIFLIFLAGILFYAKDFKIGVLLHFVGFMLIFMWQYQLEMNYVPALVLGIIFAAILSISLFASNNKSQRGAFI